jgi:uncharacterized SAM-binding protein YcdF (DUF218 family)
MGLGPLGESTPLADDAGVVVILGAAVWTEGQASGAMIRRVDRALELREVVPDVVFLPTGGVGMHPPSEARVMAALLLEAGVPAARILLEETAANTLASAVACAALLSASDARAPVWVCSDDYHMLRTRTLFWMLGVPTRGWPARMPSGAGGTSARLRCWVRDLVALTVDVPLLAWWLVTGRAERG